MELTVPTRTSTNTRISTNSSTRTSSNTATTCPQQGGSHCSSNHGTGQHRNSSKVQAYLHTTSSTMSNSTHHTSSSSSSSSRSTKHNSTMTPGSHNTGRARSPPKYGNRRSLCSERHNFARHLHKPTRSSSSAASSTTSSTTSNNCHSRCIQPSSCCQRSSLHYTGLQGSTTPLAPQAICLQQWGPHLHTLRHSYSPHPKAAAGSSSSSSGSTSITSSSRGKPPCLCSSSHTRCMMFPT